MPRIANVPALPEVGGYVNQERALALLGSTSKGGLHDLVARGKIAAAYFDERTLMYSRASLEAYIAERAVQERSGTRRGRPRGKR